MNNTVLQSILNATKAVPSETFRYLIKNMLFRDGYESLENNTLDSDTRIGMFTKDKYSYLICIEKDTVSVTVYDNDETDDSEAYRFSYQINCMNLECHVGNYSGRSEKPIQTFFKILLETCNLNRYLCASYLTHTNGLNDVTKTMCFGESEYFVPSMELRSSSSFRNAAAISPSQSVFGSYSDIHNNEKSLFSYLSTDSHLTISSDNLESFYELIDFTGVDSDANVREVATIVKRYFSPVYCIIIALRPHLEKPDTHHIEAIMYAKKVPYIKTLVKNFIDDFTQSSKDDPMVGILVQGNSLYISYKPIKPYPMDIDKHYNDSFKPVHDTIIDKLTNTNKGIILLHGIAGSGKSNYIKNLTTMVTDKNFVYIPSTMIEMLNRPDTVDLFIENPNLVLVLEDCEKYLEQREGSDSGNAVSTILNLTDGIMSDIVGGQLICTFNGDVSAIDKALLRKGRLIAEYEFTALTADKTKALGGEGEMVLADLLNPDEPVHKVIKKTRSIGFSPIF